MGMNNSKCEFWQNGCRAGQDDHNGVVPLLEVIAQDDRELGIYAYVHIVCMKDWKTCSKYKKLETGLKSGQKIEE